MPRPASVRAQPGPGRNTRHVKRKTPDQPSAMARLAPSRPPLCPPSAGCASATSISGHATPASTNSEKPTTSSGKPRVRRASQSSLPPTPAPTNTNATAEARTRSSTAITGVAPASARLELEPGARPEIEAAVVTPFACGSLRASLARSGATQTLEHRVGGLGDRSSDDAAQLAEDPLADLLHRVDAAARELRRQDLLDHHGHLLGRDAARLEPGLLERDADRAARRETIERGAGLELTAGELERRRIGHAPLPRAGRIGWRRPRLEPAARPARYAAPLEGAMRLRQVALAVRTLAPAL